MRCPRSVCVFRPLDHWEGVPSVRSGAQIRSSAYLLSKLECSALLRAEAVDAHVGFIYARVCGINARVGFVNAFVCFIYAFVRFIETLVCPI